MPSTTESSGYGEAVVPGSPPVAWYAARLFPHSVTAPVGDHTVLSCTMVPPGNVQFWPLP